MELKKKGIAVTIGLGGWNDSAGDKYSRLITDPSARARFIKHVTDFIERYNFDGLDLDYVRVFEYFQALNLYLNDI